MLGNAVVYKEKMLPLKQSFLLSHLSRIQRALKTEGRGEVRAWPA